MYKGIPVHSTTSPCYRCYMSRAYCHLGSTPNRIRSLRAQTINVTSTRSVENRYFQSKLHLKKERIHSMQFKRYSRFRKCQALNSNDFLFNRIEFEN